MADKEKIKVILLIDEYDVPLAKASEKDTAKNRYYSQMLATPDRGTRKNTIKEWYENFLSELRKYPDARSENY